MLPISQRLCTLQADIKVCPSLEATQVDAIVSYLDGVGQGINIAPDEWIDGLARVVAIHHGLGYLEAPRPVFVRTNASASLRQLIGIFQRHSSEHRQREEQFQLAGMADLERMGVVSIRYVAFRLGLRWLSYEFCPDPLRFDLLAWAVGIGAKAHAEHVSAAAEASARTRRPSTVDAAPSRVLPPVRGLGDEGDGLVMMEMPRQ